MEISAAAQWINETFADFDYALLQAFHNLHESSVGFIFDPFFYFITLLGNGGLFLIILSLFLMLFKKTRKPGASMLGAVVIGALFTNVTIKPIIARPRPYADVNGIFHQWWVSAGSHLESEFSFPSGHTTSATAAMTGLFFTGNRKYSWTAFIFALLMGMSRIIICVHYPSDVLGGFVIGFAAGVLSYLLIKWFYANSENKLNKKVIDFDIISAFKSLAHKGA